MRYDGSVTGTSWDATKQMEDRLLQGKSWLYQHSGRGFPEKHPKFRGEPKKEYIAFWLPSNVACWWFSIQCWG
jgi:hypothetical protein